MGACRLAAKCGMIVGGVNGWPLSPVRRQGRRAGSAPAPRVHRVRATDDLGMDVVGTRCACASGRTSRGQGSCTSLSPAAHRRTSRGTRADRSVTPGTSPMGGTPGSRRWCATPAAPSVALRSAGAVLGRVGCPLESHWVAGRGWPRLLDVERGWLGVVWPAVQPHGAPDDQVALPNLVALTACVEDDALLGPAFRARAEPARDARGWPNLD